MTEETALRGIITAAPVAVERQRRILQLVAQEAKLAIDEARNIALEEAKRKATGIVSEAKRKAEEIVFTAKQEAAQIISEAKERAQTELKEAEQYRSISDSPHADYHPPLLTLKSTVPITGRWRYWPGRTLAILC